MANKLHIGFIVALVLLATQLDAISIQFGKPTTPTDHAILHHTSQLQNITGTLITTPHLESTRFALLNRLQQYNPSPTQPTLQGQVYNLTHRDIKQIFKDLASEDHHINLILENQTYKQSKNYFRIAEQEFAPYPSIRLQNDRPMGTEYVHSKFFLTPDTSIIQTANLTYGWLRDSIEHLFMTTHTGIHTSLNTIFNRDRAGESITLNDIHPNLVICNINCRTIITDLLANAQESIHIMTQYLADPALISLLKNKHHQINLQLLLSTSTANNTLHHHFPTDTIRIHTPDYLHTKTILIDDRILLIGSMNLSTNSLDNNREVGILITDPTIISQYKQQFHTLRSQAD